MNVDRGKKERDKECTVKQERKWKERIRKEEQEKNEN
jgi:hypothetical protein